MKKAFGRFAAQCTIAVRSKMTESIFKELIDARRLVNQKEEETLHFIARKLDALEKRIKELERQLANSR